jgi:hypothetical protein
MDGGDEQATDTLKMVIKVFRCSGDESSCFIITSYFFNHEPSNPLFEYRSDGIGPLAI